VLAEARWPAELLDELRQFTTTKTSASVRVTRSEPKGEDENAD
jgi:hypothetical protein